MRILGVDPGSRLLGFGCVDLIGNQLRHVTHGTLRLSNTGGKAVIPLEERLHLIYEGLGSVILQHKPSVMAIEKVFFAKNAVSALKLGQARGVAIVTARIHGLAIVEYSASEVKQAVAGHGGAQKDQVARMVGLLTGQREFATSDASDALAIAICHAHAAGVQGSRGSAFANALQSASGRRSKKSSSLAESLGITPESVAGQRRVRLDRNNR
jgi:crossover junction endodeoxyribonuclease RuvC